jgi:hypothetical protein
VAHRDGTQSIEISRAGFFRHRLHREGREFESLAAYQPSPKQGFGRASQQGEGCRTEVAEQRRRTIPTIEFGTPEAFLSEAATANRKRPIDIGSIDET